MNLYLVDENGTALNDSVVSSVRKLERKIIRRFGSSCDPAVISDRVEAAALAAQKYQQENDVRSIQAVVWTCVRHMLRWTEVKQRREVTVSEASAQRLEASVTPAHDRHVLARQAFAALTAREQEMYWLSLEGAGSVEIGEIFGLTPGTTRTMLKIARKKMRAAVNPGP